MIRLSLIAILLAGCTTSPRPIDPTAGEPIPSNLNFAYCEKIAEEVRQSGKLSNNLCPGFMPDGYWVEIP